VQSTSAGDIRAVLEESGPDYEEFSFEPASSGNRADVYLVSLVYDGTEYEVVVKFKPEGDDRFAVEPRLHEYVADRTDVPVPRILVFEPDPVRDVPPYFVTERVHGEELADGFGDLTRDGWDRVVEQVGRILGDMHSGIGFEAYGRLVLRKDRIAIDDWRGDWRDYFADLTREHVSRLSNTPFANVTDRALAALESGLPTVPRDGVPRLVHDDLQPTNLLFARDEPEPITAVLDWQDTLAAHPEYQLAQAEFLYIESTFDDPDRRDRLRDRLFEGYREHRSFERSARYQRCKPVYQLSTLLWRMSGFDEAFDEDDLERARAEFQYRQQFDRLTDELRA
jgi:aminoglycoside phosphotransferase (APT) family kinase protein